MIIKTFFHSYFKELAGCSETVSELEPGSSIADLLKLLYRQFPRLEEMKRSTLIAVGLEYQKGDYPLREGDEVSLFPPVQGG